MAVIDPNDKEQRLREGSAVEKMEAAKKEQQPPQALNTLLEIRDRKMLARELEKLDDPIQYQTQPDIGSQVVTKAFDVTSRNAERAEQLIRQKEQEVSEAKSREDKAKGDVLAMVMSNMSNMQSELLKNQREMAAGNPPKNTSSTIADLKDLAGLLQQLTQKPDVAATSQQLTAGTSPMQIELIKLQQQHEKEMKMLDIRIAELNNNMKLDISKFEDDRHWKEVEFKEKQDSRNNVLGQFGDIAMGIAAGFKGSQGGQGISAEAQNQNPPHYHAKKSQTPPPATMPEYFACESCGNAVKAPAAVGLTSTCENPQCQMEYRWNPPPSEESEQPNGG